MRNEVMGAEIVSHSAFRICYATNKGRQNLDGSSQPLNEFNEKSEMLRGGHSFRWKVRKTRPLDCGIGMAMTMVRRAAVCCLSNRTLPLIPSHVHLDLRNWAQNDRQNEPERRILFIVNPKSGKGK